MTLSRKEYFKYYAVKNRERLRNYKRVWNYCKRHNTQLDLSIPPVYIGRQDYKKIKTEVVSEWKTKRKKYPDDLSDLIPIK